jgi:hypothetical protein
MIGFRWKYRVVRVLLLMRVPASAMFVTLHSHSAVHSGDRAAVELIISLGRASPGSASNLLRLVASLVASLSRPLLRAELTRGGVYTCDLIYDQEKLDQGSSVNRCNSGNIEARMAPIDHQLQCDARSINSRKRATMDELARMHLQCGYERHYELATFLPMIYKISKICYLHSLT